MRRHLRKRQLHTETWLDPHAPRDPDPQKVQPVKREGGSQGGRERERGRSRASLSSRAWSLCCRSLGIRPLPAQSCTVRSVHPAQDSRRLLLRAHLGNMLIFIHENSSASLKRSKLAQEPCSLCPETGICPLSHEDRLDHGIALRQLFSELTQELQG